MVAPENSGSESDSAPEEVGFESARTQSKRFLNAQRETVAAQSRISKEKRRTRDNQLKAQSEEKRKLLSEILKEAEEEEAQNAEKEKEKLKVTPRLPISKPSKSKKLFEVEKEGIKVKVVKATSKKLPPPASNLASRREKFLRRKSVRRG